VVTKVLSSLLKKVSNMSTPASSVISLTKIHHKLYQTNSPKPKAIEQDQDVLCLNFITK